MRLHEFATPLKTFIARVKLKNGSIVIATERTESLSYARVLLQHKFGVKNVFSVSEVKNSVIDEATITLTPQQLQVKSLSDKAKQLNLQKKQLQARQAMAAAQEKMRQANQPTKSVH
jgi:phage shock protein A